MRREIQSLHLSQSWISETAHSEHTVMWSTHHYSRIRWTVRGSFLKGTAGAWGHGGAVLNHFPCPHFTYWSGINQATLRFQAWGPNQYAVTGNVKWTEVSTVTGTGAVCRDWNGDGDRNWPRLWRCTWLADGQADTQIFCAGSKVTITQNHTVLLWMAHADPFISSLRQWETGTLPPRDTDTGIITSSDKESDKHSAEHHTLRQAYIEADVLH